MSDEQQQGTDDEFIGYAPAAEYLKLHPRTLSRYVSSGHGPTPCRRQVDRHYMRPVFTRSELDRWSANRPGQGARSDLNEN